MQAVVIVQKFPFGMALRFARAARALGLQPIMISDASSPIAMAANEGFECHPIDDWRPEAVGALVDRIVASNEVAGVFTGSGLFTGHGLLGAQVSAIAARLGLPHTPARAIWAANNKYLMRRTLHDAGLDPVRYARVVDERSLEAACEHVGFPLILKPVVGIGSSFIYRCESAEDARTGFAHFRANAPAGFYNKLFEPHELVLDGQTVRFDPLRELLAEQYVEGLEFSVECLCTNDAVVPLMVHDKLCVEESNYTVYETLLITPPVRADARQAEAMKSYAAAAVDALGLRNAFCHVELRLDDTGRPRVLEINPRLGGMRVVDSLADARGIDYAQTMVRLAVGERFAVPDAPPEARYFGMMAFYPRSSGTLTAINGLGAAASIPGVRSVRRYYGAGDHVGGDFEEVFVVDAWFDGRDADEIFAIDERIRNTVTLEVEPPAQDRPPAAQKKQRTRQRSHH